MPRPRCSRRDFIRLMAAGGLSFLGSPLAARMIDDLGLSTELRRAGVDDASNGGESGRGALATWGRLRFRGTTPLGLSNDDDWNAHPHGDLNLIGSINQQTSAIIEPKWNVADVAELDTMCRFPLLFMHAEIAVDLSRDEQDHLRDYLDRGGFLYAEDCVNGKYAHGQPYGSWDYFFQSMLPLLRGLFIDATLERLDDRHEIFHSFFDLPNQPIMQGANNPGWGLTHRGRLVAYLSSGDAHCGWANSSWFGQRKSDEALKMGANVYVYAMTH